MSIPSGDKVLGQTGHLQDHNDITDVLRDHEERITEVEGGSLGIADVSGLQAALDAKAPTNEPDLDGPVTIAGEHGSMSLTGDDFSMSVSSDTGVVASGMTMNKEREGGAAVEVGDFIGYVAYAQGGDGSDLVRGLQLHVEVDGTVDSGIVPMALVLSQQKADGTFEETHRWNSDGSTTPASGGGGATGTGTGGTESDDGDYRVHVYDTPGDDTFVVSGGELNIEYLICGGGAPGYAMDGGGGGAGGFAHGWMTIPEGTYAIHVGEKGVHGSANTPGTIGGESHAFDIYGGAGGLAGGQDTSANDVSVTGSSGGGGGGTNAPTQLLTVKPGHLGITHSGANGVQNTRGGGGGGAGTAASGGNGGEGIECSITGTAVVYCSGGGAGQRSGSTPYPGGTGAGSGGINTTTDATNATTPGSGGGGSGGSGPGAFLSGVAGDGADGIVVIRWKAA